MACKHEFVASPYPSYVQCSRCFTLKSTAPEDPKKIYTDTYWSGHRSTPEAQIHNLDVHLERGVTKTNFLLSKIRVANRNAAIDIGCFPGIMLKRLVEYGFDYVLGVDAIEIPQRIRREHGIIATAVQGYFPGVAVESGKYDVVTGSDVFEHVDDPEGFLKECFRVCAPGGQLLLITPLVVAGCFDERMLCPPEHVYLHSLENVREMVKDAGFERVEFDVWTSGHDLISARKPS